MRIPGTQNITGKFEITIGTVTNELMSQLATISQQNPSTETNTNNNDSNTSPNTPPPPYCEIEPNPDNQTPSAPEANSMAVVAIN